MTTCDKCQTKISRSGSIVVSDGTTLTRLCVICNNKAKPEECFMCGDTATHFEATTTKAACCKCCGDCPDNCKGRK